MLGDSVPGPEAGELLAGLWRQKTRLDLGYLGGPGYLEQ